MNSNTAILTCYIQFDQLMYLKVGEKVKATERKLSSDDLTIQVPIDWVVKIDNKIIIQKPNV